jgi:hypothetical protein
MLKRAVQSSNTDRALQTNPLTRKDDQPAAGAGRKLRKRRVDLAVAFALFVFAALLIRPLFRIEYFNNWGSIDSTFIADARFLVDHWPHPLWQPLWYCGTRFDYIYPPALRYGTAIVAMMADVSTARGYHLYTAFLYCLGSAGVFALVRTVAGSRAWAAVAAIAIATVSPSFLVLPSFRVDSALHMPQRLNVLIKWGEGPHISALSLLPFALLFCWRALSQGGALSSVLAALCCALVVAHNFYGATALAVFFPLIIWSIWITHRDRRVFLRAGWIVLLAYGLSGFWLTPSYLRITLDNLKLVAQPGNAWSRWLAVLAAILFAAMSWKFARGQKCRSYAVFLAGSVLVFSLVVAGHYYLGFRVVGEPHRFVPELDLVLILAVAEILRRLAGMNWQWGRLVVAAAVLAALAGSYPYLRRPWSVFVADPNYRSRIEYRLGEWLSTHLPGGRTFATGSLRFWYNVWNNDAQVGGGSDQGILNGILAHAQWQVMNDPQTGRDLAWLQAMGADAIVVPEPQSGVVFHEYKAPRKFAGVLPVLYDDGAGNIIYKVPRRYPSHARIVRTAEADSLPTVPQDDNTDQLAAYVKSLEQGPDRPAEMRRDGPELIRIRATLREGESLVVQESYDPAWRAYSQGKSLEIRKDPVGFMRVYATPGDQEVRMVFELPFENRIGRILTALSILIAGYILLRSRLDTRRGARDPAA